jgi:hypothetical protein
MRSLFSVGYFGSWLIAAALLSYVLTALLWGIANVSQLTGVDDDVALLALPIGAVLGVWGAVRGRYASVLHRAFFICGILIAAVGTVMAIRFFQSSGQAAGSGPFAGFGELVAAGMSIVIVVFGASMSSIWAFATLAKFRKPVEHDAGPEDASVA